MIENVKATIRKLLNLAADKSAADGEIENAMRFASRLMQQHNLSDDDLTEIDDVLIDLERKECGYQTAATGGAKMSQWEPAVALFACELVGGVKYFCSDPQILRENGILKTDASGNPIMRATMVFYGIAEDAELARLVFSESIVIIAAAAKLKWGGVYRGPGRCYCEGFAAGLLTQLSKDQERLIRESDSRALVVIDQRKQIVEKKTAIAEKWLKSEGVKLSDRSESSNRSFDDRAYADGKTDGGKHSPSAERRKKIGAS